MDAHGANHVQWFAPFFCCTAWPIINLILTAIQLQMSKRWVYYTYSTAVAATPSHASRGRGWMPGACCAAAAVKM